MLPPNEVAELPAPLPLAPLSTRFLGHLYDVSVVYAGVMLATALDTALSKEPLLPMLFLLALGAINLFLIARQGQSLGKVLAGTRIVSMDDRPIEAWRVALLRWPVMLLGLIDILFLLGESRRALHDRSAGTRVVAAETSAHVYVVEA